MFRIENVIRLVINTKCIEAYGKNWVKAKLPKPMRDKITEGIKYGREIIKSDYIIDNPLSYIDFPDLRQILQKGDLWGEVFSKIFSKQDILGMLERSEKVRNSIAHNRLINVNDLDFLSVLESEISIELGEKVYTEFFQNSFNLQSPSLRIAELSSFLQTVLDSVEGFYYNLKDYFRAMNIASEWWTADILGQDCAEKIVKAISIIRLYNKLEKKPRLEHHILEWVNRNNFLIIIREAILAIKGVI